MTWCACICGVYALVHVCVCALVHRVCVHARTCGVVCVYVHALMHACVCVCGCVCACMHACTCTHVYVCARVYTHTGCVRACVCVFEISNKDNHPNKGY